MALQVESETTVKGATDVDIGCGNSFGGGGDDEGVDDAGAEKVNNVIEPFGFSECPFGSKTELKDYLKEYVRKVRTVLKEGGTPQPEVSLKIILLTSYTSLL
jgi:Translationally controlled tumour protein